MDSAQAGFIRGLRVCVEMLKTMGDLDDHAIESHCRSLQPQDNAVFRALRQVLNRGDTRELEGFCAALTEMAILADAHGDCQREFENYSNRRESVMERRATPRAERKAAERRPARAHFATGRWPRIRSLIEHGRRPRARGGAYLIR